jgi:hypothetical protein
MKYYMVVHKPTGNWMPQRNRMAQTYIDFQKQSFNHFPPRLFTFIRDARWFLTVYCKGPHYEGKSQDWETGILEHTGIEVDEKSKRNREEFTILEVTMTSGRSFS